MANFPYEHRDQQFVQFPPCPHCHQTDTVQTFQTASTRKMSHKRSPSAPGKNRRGWLWIKGATGLLCCAALLVFLFLQAEGVAGRPAGWQMLAITAAMLTLPLAFGLSLGLLQKSIPPRQQTSEPSPEDNNDECLQPLYYCCHDDMVFGETSHQTFLTRDLEILPLEPTRKL